MLFVDIPILMYFDIFLFLLATLKLYIASLVGKKHSSRIYYFTIIALYRLSEGGKIPSTFEKNEDFVVKMLQIF